MALSYKSRRRLAILVLVLGLPAYIIAAVVLVSLFERPALWLECLIYIGLGIAWVLPMKRLFLGVGQADPEAGTAAPPKPPGPSQD